MTILDVPFTTTDWESVPATMHPGAPGVATWRTLEAGNIRVRMVGPRPATWRTTGASGATCCWYSRGSW